MGISTLGQSSVALRRLSVDVQSQEEILGGQEEGEKERRVKGVETCQYDLRRIPALLRDASCRVSAVLRCSDAIQDESRTSLTWTLGLVGRVEECGWSSCGGVGKARVRGVGVPGVCRVIPWE
jgi:hypothetical protein